MSKKAVLFVLLAVVVLALAAWGFIARRQDNAGEATREAPVKTPARVAQIGDQTIVTLDTASQKQSGIVVVPAQPLTHRPMLQTFGTVLDVADLLTLHANDVAAQAQVDKTRAALDASAAEYRRLQTLHSGQRDISEKALQAAEATLRGDQAALRAAQAALTAARRSAGQQWGTVLADAVANDAPLFQRLAARQQVLVQVMLPASVSLPQPPTKARLQASDGRFHVATFISPSLRADPRLQGASVFYAAGAEGLLPGMVVTAYLPTGAAVQGAVIPSSAIVWWRGQPWAYARVQPSRFVRLAVPTGNPVDGGWFVPKGFAKGAPIVQTGAQLLLSEEQRSQISSGGGDEE